MAGKGPLRAWLSNAGLLAALAVPGAGTVAHAAGLPAPGYAVSDFATGFGCAFYLCIGPIGLAFDATGQLYVCRKVGGVRSPTDVVLM
jgi:hypothetical protein